MNCCNDLVSGIETFVPSKKPWCYDVEDTDDGRRVLTFRLWEGAYDRIEPGRGMNQRDAFENYIENCRPFFKGNFLKVGPWPLWKNKEGTIYIISGPRPYPLEQMEEQ